MKPLNPPCTCLPLSCPSDGQDYWVVLLAAGLWQRDVGSFSTSVFTWCCQNSRVVLPMPRVWSRGVWNPLPGLHSHHALGFFPSLGLSLSQSFTPLCCSFFVFLIQPVSAVPACSCHLVPIPAGKSQKLAKLGVVWLLSPGFWIGRNCKELEKDYISLTLIFWFPC